MLNKKTKKLIKNPKLFFSDMINNKKKALRLVKYQGKHKFTVVSAVYGVEKYLDDYFKSLVNQTLDFKKHIYLIMVDDGSLDNSADIIKKWQKKYPDNITYIKKENGGQASARNLGLKYVQTEWVTFIDSDDFISRNYFEEIDKFLIKFKNIKFSMISSNFIFYYEDKKQFSDTHPLKYRFKKDENIIAGSNIKEDIQISVNSALFRKSIIDKFELNFNENIKPSLEDGEFSMKYLLYTTNLSIAFLKKPKYFYRKRSAGNSTLDTAWERLEEYDTVLQLACLDVLKLSMNLKGYVPYAQQKTILYHLIWKFKRIINNSASLSFLDENQISKFKLLLKQIFTYIDPEVIERFNLAGAWFYHKVGLLGMLKNVAPGFQIVYVEDYDRVKDEVLLRYFSYFDSSAICIGDNKEVLPTHSKIRRHEFLGELFVNEYYLWIPLESVTHLNVFVDNLKTRISFAGKLHQHGIDAHAIKKHFEKKKIDISKLPLHIKAKRKLYQSDFYANKFKDAWLFMDRDTQADDNAEHLYRYVKNNHPEINAYFILRKDSHDWERLKKDKFNLIDLGSTNHEAALLHAAHMIASDASKNNINYLPNKYYKDLLSYKFTFLQHGVIHTNLSKWLNTKKIDCFITSSQNEYNDIAGNHTKYKFSSKEVVLTGLPRHDNLIKNNRTNNKSIMIMPTWRMYLNELTAENNQKFRDTSYSKAWTSLLHSDFLRDISQNMGYSLRFFPHPNIKKFLNEFDIPDYIELVLNPKESIQVLFQTSDLLLTDYSSVAFEMGILGKEVIYYQFDYQEFFTGIHTVEKGYFDYKKDGFGPVCYTEKEVIESLSSFIEHSGKPNKKYIKRMQDFFAYHDTNNCKRVYEAIVKLDKPNKKSVNVKTIRRLIEEAYSQKKWKAVESRIELLSGTQNTLTQDDTLVLAEAKCALGKIDEAHALLDLVRETKENSLDIEKLKTEIARIEDLLNTLSEEEVKLLVDKDKDFFTTVQLGNIEKLFNEKKFNVLFVVFELFDNSLVPQEKLSMFYYMWGRTLRLSGQKERALEKLAHSLSYNDIKPNSALWEYASTLYEVYDERDIDKDLILGIFKDNGYEVTNVTFELIKKWFDNKHFKQVAVAFEFINIEEVDYKELSNFYYMWGVTLFFNRRYDESLDKFKLTDKKGRELLYYKAHAMTQLDKYDEAYNLWNTILEKYPNYNTAKVLNNIIYILQYNGGSEVELRKYKQMLLKSKLLEDLDDEVNHITNN